MESIEQQKLKAYAKEMGLYNESLSIDQLIEAHRTLRAYRLQSSVERQAEMQAAREFAIKQATDEVKQYGWFSIERLRGMTLAELAELIGED